jgi:hypothetical protein
MPPSLIDPSAGRGFQGLPPGSDQAGATAHDGEWLSDLLGVSLGLFNTMVTAVADYFASETPIFEFEDPYPVLPASGGLVPVKVPVRDFTVRVNDVEMIIEGNVGA